MSNARAKQGYWLAGGGAVALVAYWGGQVTLTACVLAIVVFGLIYARMAEEKAEKQAEGRESVTCMGLVCGGRQLSKSDAKKLGDGWYCSRCLEAFKEPGE